MDARELDKCPSLASPGMTLRDYFAAKAMQGLLANSNWNTESTAGIKNPCSALVEVCFRYADAMLEARE